MWEDTTQGLRWRAGHLLAECKKKETTKRSNVACEYAVSHDCILLRLCNAMSSFRETMGCTKATPEQYPIFISLFRHPRHAASVLPLTRGA